MNTQPEFETRAGGKTQNEKLEEFFRAHPGQWIDMPDLAKEIGAFAVHSRVSDLRKDRGMIIEHKNTWATEDGAQKIFSRYRFMPNVTGGVELDQNGTPIAIHEYEPAIEMPHDA